MASIEVTRTELVVRMHGWNKVLAMRSSIRLSLSHVRGARLKPKEAYYDDALIERWRGIGTYVPLKLAAGMVYLPDGHAFYHVRDPERAIAVDCDDHPLRRLVIEVERERPEAVVERIERALVRYR